MSYRIGSAQGFYGDNVLSALPMITGGHVDVVCFEALAELTLAILQKDRLKDPSRGYTFDLAIIASKILPEAFARKIPLICNGGGLNPQGAARMVRETAARQGLHGLKIAAVTGDDVLTRLEDLNEAGEPLTHLESGVPLNPAEYPIASANVYLGAAPIVAALQQGADMVITGRVADPCLYLAPLIAHYGWSWDDWHRLAAGIVVGHLLECTGQVVGGNSLGVIDQIPAQDLNKLGYPVAHVEADGSFILTKTPGLPGIVNAATVKEQLLYEVHDPAAYITPDVVADFTTLRLQDLGADRVQISGVQGRPRPEKLKLNLGRLEGYMRELIFTLGYPETWRKYAQLQTMIAETWRGLPLDRVEYQLLGINSLYGPLAPLPAEDPLELVVRVMFTARDEATLKHAVRLMMHNGLSGPAGMSVSGSTVSGEPRIILGLFPTLLHRAHITPEILYLEV
ncbi:MAG: DUF1446 domain-containing protein [Anaerolineae bacterium]|nr:DUF1446 domain-containing protein [Anaerolineae bacterium]